MIILSNLKSSVLLTLLITMIYSLESCVDPGLTGPRFAVKNRTNEDITYKGFIQGKRWRNQLLKVDERATGDEGGQLDFDSVRFVGISDSVTYIAPRLDSVLWLIQKNRSFYNLDNWVKEGDDYIYSVYEDDFN